MPLSTILLPAITEEHLQRLVETGISEGPTLDAKLALPGSGDDHKREFLRDVASMANASGGDLLFGVRDENGVIAEILGLEVSSIESEILRLSQLVRDCLDPRVFNLNISHVQLSNKKIVLVVRIPQSLDSPHMITFKSLNQFWIRQSAGKAQMTTSDVRNSVLRTHAQQEQLLQRHRERTITLLSNEGPIPVMEGPFMLVQTVPLMKLQSLDLAQSELQEEFRRIGPPMGSSHGRWYTFDGYLLAGSRSNEIAHSYRLFGYDGMVEAVMVYYVQQGESGGPCFSIDDMDSEITRLIDENVNALKAMNVHLPIAVLVSVCGVKGAKFRRQGDDRYDIADRLPVAYHKLVLPPLVLPEYPGDLRDALLPLLDRLWQSAGFPRTLAPRGQG